MPLSQFEDLPSEVMVLVNKLCNHFEKSWQADKNPRLEAYLKKVPGDYRPILLKELIPIEINYRERKGEEIKIEEFVQRFPDSNRESLDELLETKAIDRTEITQPFSDELTTIKQGISFTLPHQLGDYELTERIGRGGMGTVYKAIHNRMGRTVAVKILHPEIQQNEEFQKRFDREVRTAASLNHPHLVTALDAREENGLHYFVTEYIEGYDLQSYVNRQGPLTLLQSLDVILQTARGLEYAHANGIIHRDIKPANLLQDQNGTVKILDMGLARIVSAANDETDHSELTSTGIVMGTAPYMSPEQARSTRDAGPESDLYSLGCTFYFLLHGKPPFLGRTAVETILSHVNEPIPRLMTAPALHVEPRLKKELEGIFQRMLAKEKSARIQSMSALIQELEAIRERIAAIETETEVITRTLPSTRKTTIPFWGIVLLLVILFIPVGYIFWPATGETPLESGDSSVAENTPRVERVPSVEEPITPSPVETINTIYPALSFNGVSSYIEVDDFPAPGTGPVTLEATVRMRTIQTCNVISWLGENMMSLYMNADGHWGIARLEGEQSLLIRAVEPAELNTTTHLAGIWTGEELQLFINGRRVETAPLTFDLPADTEAGLYIGGTREGALPHLRFVNGDICRVRVSKSVVYNRNYEIPDRLEPVDQTLGLYLLESPSGNTSSGNTSSVDTVQNIADPERYRGQVNDAVPTAIPE
ncbi:MAG: protein kinase [Planctomycetaceae bacterium]